MAPIRVGILGLSASGTSGTSWGERAHLDYLKKSPKYEVVALCNSSVESSERAVKSFGLPASTKAYGDPEDLANDPNVDLVVSSTRVDKHAETVLASLKKGKDVFCEWPLARNLVEAEELLAVAKKSGSRTMVGLQGRVAPAVVKLKEIVKSGRIGDVLSSTFVGSPGNGGETEGKGVFYFTDREVGGNMVSIHFGHTFDALLHALGELEQFNSIMAVQRKAIDIVDRETNTIVEKGRPKNTFDQIAVQGFLPPNNTVNPVLSYHLRGGKPFPSSQKPLLWRVYGSKGEIEVTASNVMLNVGSDDVELWVYENGKDAAEKVELNHDEFLAGLPLPGRNIGKLYELFAGKDEGAYPTFEDAVRRHRLIDEMEKRADNGTQVRRAEYVQG